MKSIICTDTMVPRPQCHGWATPPGTTRSYYTHGQGRILGCVSIHVLPRWCQCCADTFPFACTQHEQLSWRPPSSACRSPGPQGCQLWLCHDWRWYTGKVGCANISPCLNVPLLLSYCACTSSCKHTSFATRNQIVPCLLWPPIWTLNLHQPWETAQRSKILVLSINIWAYEQRGPCDTYMHCWLAKDQMGIVS